MPKCPFADWTPISGPVGPYVSGPFKIVHHTTEGHSAKDAMSAYKKNKSDPHFTVDSKKIYQHIDTSLSARALRNAPGGVQTNKDGAIQIEVVGFAHLKKDLHTLTNVAMLCRWLEAVHKVPQSWPNGLPKTATPSGKDPGGHNRNAVNWDTKAGHYGHSHVPENTHWDPGYTKDEVNFIMEADFDSKGNLLNEKVVATAYDSIFSFKPGNLANIASTMPDRDEPHAADFDEYALY